MTLTMARKLVNLSFEDAVIQVSNYFSIPDLTARNVVKTAAERKSYQYGPMLVTMPEWGDYTLELTNKR